MIELSAIQQIEELQQKIQNLKQQALDELKDKLAQARLAAADLEAQLAEMTGEPAPDTSALPRVRSRRPSISDEDLRLQIRHVMYTQGRYGLNAKTIADQLNQDPLRVRGLLAATPDMFTRQGHGPGTRFFLTLKYRQRDSGPNPQDS